MGGERVRRGELLRYEKKKGERRRGEEAGPGRRRYDGTGRGGGEKATYARVKWKAWSEGLRVMGSSRVKSSCGSRIWIYVAWALRLVVCGRVASKTTWERDAEGGRGGERASSTSSTSHPAGIQWQSCK